MADSPHRSRAGDRPDEATPRRSTLVNALGIGLVSAGVMMTIATPGVVGLVAALGGVAAIALASKSFGARSRPVGGAPPRSVLLPLLFFVIAFATAFAAVWSAGVTEDEYGARHPAEAGVIALLFALVALGGFLTRRFDFLAAVAVVALGLILVWEAIVQLSDGEVLWNPSSYGSPIFLLVAVPLLAVPVATGVWCGRLAHSMRRPRPPSDRLPRRT